MASPAAPSKSASPLSPFFVILVVVAVVGASVLGYLGITGKIGTGVVGTYPGNVAAPAPLDCEGRGALGTFNLSFVAGAGTANSGLNFNGSSPGPCVQVAQGSTVNVAFSVAASAGTNHSWVLVAYTGNSTNASGLPTFAGAGFSNGARFTGIAPGSPAVRFHFVVDRPGTFQYISEVPGEYAHGMYGWFYVNAAPAS